MKAHLRNYRQSPRKVRLVVDLIRGKKAEDALALLTFTTKRASAPVKKLLESAIANAKHNSDIDLADLTVAKCSVDQGATMWRWMPRARGSSAPIRKRTCHVSIELASSKAAAAKEEKAPKAKAAKPKKATKAKKASK